MTLNLIDKIDNFYWSYNTSVTNIPIFVNHSSTTKYFRDNYTNLEIKLLSKEFEFPNNFDQERLDIKANDTIWVRSVEIKINDVWAITAEAKIFTSDYNNPSFKKIHELGNKPLGEILYNCENEYEQEEMLYSDINFARNRCFYSGEIQISLTEIFNPDFNWL